MMRKLLPWLTLLFCGCLAAAWMGCAFLDGIGWADDFPYSHLPLPGSSEQDFFDCKGPVITGLNDFPQACLNHFIAINGRLANMLAFAVLRLPYPLVFLLNAIAWSCMLLGTVRIAYGSQWYHHRLAIILSACALWVILPWQDNLASQDYYMNYVWSSALNLCFLSLIIHPSKHVTSWLLCLLGALAATMHEGMSAAICVGLCLWLLFRRGSGWLPVSIYILFALLPLSSPGIWALAASRTASHFDLHFFTHIIGLTCIITFIAGGITIVSMVRNRRLIDATQAVVWSIIIAGLLIAIVSHQGGRALWLPICLSLSVILATVHPRLSHRTAGILTIISATCLTVWCVWVCVWQYRASQERNRLMDIVIHQGDTVYIDLLQPDDLPWGLLGTVAYVNGDQTVRSNIAAHLYADAWHTLALLPASWQGKTLSELPQIPGTAGAHGHPYIFLSRQPVAEAQYTHSTAGEFSPALHPIKSLRHRLHTGSTPAQTMLMECHRINDSTYACRPRYLAFSHIGLPVIRIDKLN